MGTGIIALAEAIILGQLHYYLLFFLFTWMVYAPKWYLAKVYFPYVFPEGIHRFHKEVAEHTAMVLATYSATDPEDIRKVLRSMQANYMDPALQVVVINGISPQLAAIRDQQGIAEADLGRFSPIAQVCAEMQVDWVFEPWGDKPNALVTGLEYIKVKATRLNRYVHAIVMSDDDEELEPGAVMEMIKALSDPFVNSVSGEQAIVGEPIGISPQALSEFAEDLRRNTSIKAGSVVAQVPCQPGRCYVIRAVPFIGETASGRGVVGAVNRVARFVFQPFLFDPFQRFVKDFFNWAVFGRRTKVSDDRRITWLSRVYGTVSWNGGAVYQSTSKLYTQAPDSFPKLWRQLLRWNKGSRGMTLTSYFSMLIRAQWMFFVYIADIILPYFWFGTIFNAVYNITTERHEYVTFAYIPIWAQFVIGAGGLLLTFVIRHWGYYTARPGRWIFLVPNIAFLTFFHTFNGALGMMMSSTHMIWGTRGSSPADVFNTWLSRIFLAVTLVTAPLFFWLWPPLVQTNPVAFGQWMGVAFGFYFLMFALVVWTKPNSEPKGSLVWYGWVTQFIPLFLGLSLIAIFTAAGQVTPAQLAGFSELLLELGGNTLEWTYDGLMRAGGWVLDLIPAGQ